VIDFMDQHEVDTLTKEGANVALAELITALSTFSTNPVFGNFVLLSSTLVQG
jgi:hypothetical protein